MNIYFRKVSLFIILFFSIFKTGLMIAFPKNINKLSSIPIKTLSASFQREEIENDRLLKTEGTIFFSIPDRVWIVVKKPVNQIIKIDSTFMLIYYPANNLAFKINSKNSFSSSFISPFIASLRSDYGLSDLNYQMKKFEMVLDTLITEWHPHEQDKKKLGTTIIKMVSNKINQVIILDTSNKNSLQKFVFKNYILINNIHWVPNSVTTFKNVSKNQFFDKVELKNIYIDAALPDSIIGFTIPPNATIKEYKW